MPPMIGSLGHKRNRSISSDDPADRPDYVSDFWRFVNLPGSTTEPRAEPPLNKEEPLPDLILRTLGRTSEPPTEGTSTAECGNFGISADAFVIFIF